MNELALLVSDECDRLLAELRSISSNQVLKQIQDEIVSLKLNLFTNSIQISQILSPFEKIITDEQTTDFITSLALSSVNTFISFNLLQSSLDVDSICNTIKNCQFQSTSDFDCAAVSYRILTCIISLCRTDLLNSKTLLIIFDYVMNEIKNSDRNISPILIDALSSISTYIFQKNINNDFLIEKLLTNLYFLCQCECYYRQCGLICLLQVSRVTKDRNDSLMAVTCSLFHKFIISIDNRDNFVLILRLFTHVFIDKYMTYPLPFTRCFLELLNFIDPPNSNKTPQSPTSQSQFLAMNYHLKRIALEVVSDFISQPNFLLNLFVNLNGRTYFPNIFDKLIKVYFTNLDKKDSIIKLNLPDVKILTNNQHNFNFTVDKKEMNLIFATENERYHTLLQFSEQFNANPSFFIKNSDNFYTPHKIALNLIESPNLSRKQIGEFFAKNKAFCMETLQEYLELLDFSNLDFDSSIRLFLSGFQIAGEGQIVDRIFEYFSERFFRYSSDRVHFKTKEAVHILAYAWLMIHTSFHNNNVTKKPTFDGFLKMLENQNNGDNFDVDFLNDIFESVKNVKVPFEDSEQEGSVAHWRLLLCRQKLIGFKFVLFPNIESNCQTEKLTQKLTNSENQNENENKVEDNNKHENENKVEDNNKCENENKVEDNKKHENENKIENNNKHENKADDNNKHLNENKVENNNMCENENNTKCENNDDDNKCENIIKEDDINRCRNENNVEIENEETKSIKKEDEIQTTIITREIKSNENEDKNNNDTQTNVTTQKYEEETKSNKDDSQSSIKAESESSIENESQTKSTKDETSNGDDIDFDTLIEEIENSINESPDISQSVNDSSENTTDSSHTVDRDAKFSGINSSLDSLDENQISNSTESQIIDSSSDNQKSSTVNKPIQPNLNSTINKSNDQLNQPNTNSTASQSNIQINTPNTNLTINQQNTNSTFNQSNNQINTTKTNSTSNSHNTHSITHINTNQTTNNDPHTSLKSSTYPDSHHTSTHTHDPVNDDQVPLFVIEKEMFQRIWTLESSKIIDLCFANARIFHSVCQSASKFCMTDIVDNFVILFSKNSVEELLDANTKEDKEKKRKKKDEDEESTPNLFLLGSIVKNYGNSIRDDGWTSYVKLLTTLLELDLLNDDTLTFKNIAEDMKPVILCHKLVSVRKSRRNSMFSLFLSRRPSFDDLKRPTSHSNLREFVSKSGIEKFIENNSSEDSLFSLVLAIINVSQEVQSGFETDQMRIAFCAILIEKVVTLKKNLEIFLKNKKVFQKITDDFFVPVLSKKSGSFLSTLFFNEAFVIILDLWSIKPLQIDLIYFIDKIFLSPQICQNKVQVDMIEKCLSLFFKKFFQSFVSLHHLKGVLNLIQVGILQDSKPSFLLLKKFDAIKTGDFDNVRFPLIQVNTAVILVENQRPNSPNEKLNEINNEHQKRKTFSEMKPLIFVKNTSEKQWEILFNEILFPLTMKRVRYDDLILLILETFEFAVNKLCKLSLFESIWFRLLGLTLDFSKRCDADVKSQIEARLSGCISQMKKLSIFVDENSKIWSLTKSNVERVFPSIF